MLLKADKPQVWLGLSSGSNDGKCHLWGPDSDRDPTQGHQLCPRPWSGTTARPVPQGALAAALQHLHLKSIKGKTYFSSSQLYVRKHTGEDF